MEGGQNTLQVFKGPLLYKGPKAPGDTPSCNSVTRWGKNAPKLRVIFYGNKYYLFLCTCWLYLLWDLLEIWSTRVAQNCILWLAMSLQSLSLNFFTNQGLEFRLSSRFQEGKLPSIAPPFPNKSLCYHHAKIVGTEVLSSISSGPFG